jgi:hypothetical protein
MSVDLDRQLRDYTQHLDEVQGTLSFEDILERTGELMVIPRRGNQQGPPRRKWIVVAAAALLVLIIAAGIWLLPDVDDTPPPANQPTTTSVPEATVDTLLDLRLPGMNLDEPAGVYGWTGALGESGWMHKVVVNVDEDPYTRAASRQTQLLFAVENDCFPGSQGAEPVAVTVAGLDGLHLEPYERSMFLYPDPGETTTTAAYALPIGDRTLCVYLSWNAATALELSAARQVVESIRGEPNGEDGIRINFELPFGWDTG